jgi:dihydrofolate reductase
MTVTLIAAVGANRAIGRDNGMPWHLPEDLAHFKRVTLGQPIIMGRKTFDSIGRPLPGRRNIVVTRNRAWAHEGVDAVGSLEEAIALAGDESGSSAASIIGGAQIFREALDLADRMIVTHIEREYPCDTFFPEIDPGKWTATAREPQHSQAQDLDFSFVTYERIK